MSYVYILSNEYMPGVYKVGYTKNRPDSRAEELYSGSTGVPSKFRVEAFYQVFDPQDVEQYVHRKLKEYRINDGREFFRVDPVLIEQTILDFIVEQDQVVGKSSSYLNQDLQVSQLQKRTILTPFEIQLEHFKSQQRNANYELARKERDLRARLELERLQAEEREKERERLIKLEIVAEYLKLLEMAKGHLEKPQNCEVEAL